MTTINQAIKLNIGEVIKETQFQNTYLNIITLQYDWKSDTNIKFCDGLILWPLVRQIISLIIKIKTKVFLF